MGPHHIRNAWDILYCSNQSVLNMINHMMLMGPKHNTVTFLHTDIGKRHLPWLIQILNIGTLVDLYAFIDILFKYITHDQSWFKSILEWNLLFRISHSKEPFSLWKKKEDIFTWKTLAILLIVVTMDFEEWISNWVSCFLRSSVLHLSCPFLILFFSFFLLCSFCTPY